MNFKTFATLEELFHDQRPDPSCHALKFCLISALKIHNSIAPPAIWPHTQIELLKLALASSSYYSTTYVDLLGQDIPPYRKLVKGERAWWPQGAAECWGWGWGGKTLQHSHSWY